MIRVVQPTWPWRWPSRGVVAIDLGVAMLLLGWIAAGVVWVVLLLGLLLSCLCPFFRCNGLIGFIFYFV